MYTNRFTRANPGLFIYLVDQSHAMSAPWSDGRTLAEQAALVINRCIEETIKKFTDINEGIKNSVHIIIIGYGGIEKSESAYILKQGPIAKLAKDYLRIEEGKQRIADGRGGLIEVDIKSPIWLEPTAVWGTPMASAFKLAYNIVNIWVTRNAWPSRPSQDPVPIIINITQGMPTDGVENVKEWANRIKGIKCPDGNPLIFNVHLSLGSGAEIEFPKQKPTGDASAELMYELSSELPEAFVNDAKAIGFDVEGGEKTFISNCKNVEGILHLWEFGS